MISYHFVCMIEYTTPTIFELTQLAQLALKWGDVVICML